MSGASVFQLARLRHRNKALALLNNKRPRVDISDECLLEEFFFTSTKVRSGPFERIRWPEKRLRDLAVKEGSFNREFRMDPDGFDLLCEMLRPRVDNEDFYPKAANATPASGPVTYRSKVGAALTLLGGGRVLEPMRTMGINEPDKVAVSMLLATRVQLQLREYRGSSPCYKRATELFNDRKEVADAVPLQASSLADQLYVVAADINPNHEDIFRNGQKITSMKMHDVFKGVQRAYVDVRKNWEASGQNCNDFSAYVHISKHRPLSDLLVFHMWLLHIDDPNLTAFCKEGFELEGGLDTQGGSYNTPRQSGDSMSSARSGDSGGDAGGSRGASYYKKQEVLARQDMIKIMSQRNQVERETAVVNQRAIEVSTRNDSWDTHTRISTNKTDCLSKLRKLKKELPKDEYSDDEEVKEYLKTIKKCDERMAKIESDYDK